MSADPQRHLQVVVDTGTGEILHSVDGENACPQCAEHLETIAALETEKRGWRTRYQNLKRDKDAEARNHKLFPQAQEVFDYWRKATSKRVGADGEKIPRRSKFTPARFRQVEPFLREYGVEACLLAIDGAAFDPYITQHKNGTKNVHDDFGLIFRESEPEKFERFCNKAPLDSPHRRSLLKQK